MSQTSHQSSYQNNQQDKLSSSESVSFPNITIEEPHWSDYRNVFLDHKWLILGVIGTSFLVSALYVSLIPPTYRANLLIQIEDSAPDSKSFLTDTTGLGELKTTASGEMQILSSRMVIGAAVEQAGLAITAQPNYLPIIGNWLSRRAEYLSNPGFLGHNGYVTGTEKISIKHFAIPPTLEDTTPFIISIKKPGIYTVTHQLLSTPLEGVVGKLQQYDLPNGVMTFQIDELYGKPEAQFKVSVASRLRTIERLQSRLILAEQGRQSNVVSVALEDSNPERLSLTLNAIADQYVKQNVERKSAEADKTLAFLNSQLPVFERQLKTSEDAFANFRNRNGTITFDEEGKVWLKSSADLQSNILELQQNRIELRRINNENHPKIQTLNQQIAAAQNELASINKKIAAMPNVQRDALRLERDVRSNTAQFQSMQNNALQMTLLKEGKIGNVRMIDKAVVSKDPVRPQKALIVSFAIVLSTILSLGISILSARLKRGIQDANDAAIKTGLELLSVIPNSEEQAVLSRKDSSRSGQKILADIFPSSRSIEAIRGLRLALKKTFNKSFNNRILFTGATPNIGKSFLAANFAIVLAQTGKRVLLVNADLRKNDCLIEIESKNHAGLSELLNNKLDLAQVICQNVRPNLDFLPAGELPAFPTDLLESQEFSNVLNKLSEIYDYVVIDSPPVLIGADSVAIAPHCDCVLLVACFGLTEISQLKESMRRLKQAGTSISGLIMNRLPIKKTNSTIYGHNYLPKKSKLKFF